MIHIPTIRQWWDLLHNDGSPVEFRILDGTKTYSGYFTNIEDAIRDLGNYQDKAIYATLNPCNEACMDMTQAEHIIFAGRNPTTSDKAIAARNFILIDIDPERLAGVNATDEEKQYAKVMARNVFRYLRNAGFYDPVIADSANGFHLYYKVRLANSDENTELVKKFLRVLEMHFSDEHCKIDTSVFNASRISKIIGTSSAKGRNTAARPQRMSSFIYVPDEIKDTNRVFIEKVAAELPEAPKPTRENNYEVESFDLESFLTQYGIEIVKRVPFSGGERLILRECPFDPNHKAPDAAIFKMSNGAIAFKCFHNSCSAYTWKDFRLHFDPSSYDRKDRREYESRHRYDRPRMEQRPEPKAEDENIGKKWLDPTAIKWVDPNSFPFIPTGINALDKAMLGLTMGDVTIVSGLAGAGKTSLLDLIILNAVDKGFKVAAWSGELQDFRFMSWLDQMAAGKTNVRARPGYEGIYYTPKNTSESINKWLSGKFWLYNNSYGNKWSQIGNDIKDMVEKEKPDLIMVDNLTAIDLDIQGGFGDKNDSQKVLINDLKNFAKAKNIHICLVCHPRKEQSFHMLRMESIAGSSDLFNLCDNVLLVHRGGHDLASRMKTFFPPHVIEQYSTFDTLIEVAKNRSHGRADTLVGMYYEKETRRFLNDIFENRVYGWDNTAAQLTYIDFPKTKPLNEFEQVAMSESDDDTDDLPL